MFWNVFRATLTFLGPLPTVVQVSSAWGMDPGRGLSRPPMFPEQEHKIYLLRARALQKLTTYHAYIPAWRLWIIERKEGKVLHSICSLFFHVHWACWKRKGAYQPLFSLVFFFPSSCVLGYRTVKPVYNSHSLDFTNWPLEKFRTENWPLNRKRLLNTELFHTGSTVQ